MQLAYIADPLSIHTQRWLTFFARQGHAVHLIDLRAPGRVPAPPLPGVTIHEVHKGPKLPLPRAQGLLYYPVAAARTRRIVARLRPALLHAHYISEHAWVAALSGFRPLVLTAWGGDVLAEQGALDRRSQRLLTPFAIRAAALLTADAAPLVAVLDRYRRPTTPVLLIRFGADHALFHPGVATAALRQALDLGAGPVVFSPRSFQPVYRIELIVRAWPLVIAQRPDARLLLKSYFADPAYAARLQQLVAELGIADSVRFAGATDYDALPAYYNLAAATVSVPASDGLPATVLEALACGSALVVTDLPWTHGVIVHEQNGLLVPPGDVVAITTALLRLLNDAELRQRLVANGLTFSAAHGDWDGEMRKMEQGYRGLVQREG
jgi:L-malate glycosyltransferase